MKQQGKGMKRVGQKRPARRKHARRAALTAFIVAVALIMLALVGYVGWWYVHQGRVRSDSQRYAELYGGRQNTLVIDVTAIPTDAPTPVPTVAPTVRPTAIPTAEPTAKPTAKPTEVPTAEPTPPPTGSATAEPKEVPTVAPTPKPTSTPTAEPTAKPTESSTPSPSPYVLNADMPVVEDEPIPTPAADTKVYALPTPPPVQPGFASLLALNPETVGFLELDGMLSLPVVQRENDNEYYLSHGFEGGESREGTLFLDGLNRLVPEDDCLLVYGHNMKNDTMFGKLDAYEGLDYLRQHSVIHFDTLYENRSYVVFAAFTASMEAGNSRYFDVRQFIFDDVEFNKFVLKLQSRSRFKIPIEVEYGDHLLLLVTCDYTGREGRFILALRQIRPDETEAGVWAQASQATLK